MSTAKKLKNASAALLLALFVTAQPASAQEGEIAKIDTNRVLEVHPAFVEAQVEFEERLMEMQQELETMPEEEQLEAQQRLEAEIQELGMRLQEEALDELRNDLQEFADERGYDYVMDSTLLLVGGVDVTEEVIDNLQ